MGVNVNVIVQLEPDESADPQAPGSTRRRGCPVCTVVSRLTCTGGNVVGKVFVIAIRIG